MILLMILILLTETTCVLSRNVGSTLFFERSALECWSNDDIAKLRARQYFEYIIPQPVVPVKVDGKYVSDTVRYYRKAIKTVERSDRTSVHILKEALLDTIGGHLHSEILPAVRFASYAGYVPYRQVRKIHDMLDDIKRELNTLGNGWKPPARIPNWANLTVIRMQITPGREGHPCRALVIKRDKRSCIRLPWPKVDDHAQPQSLALPFKDGGFVSLWSPRSENALVKYYMAASRCILRQSPANCRHADFVNFNNELWQWMKREVAPHLADERPYAAYSGVLRVAAAVQRYGHGLARRSLLPDHPLSSLLHQNMAWDYTSLHRVLFLRTCNTGFIYVLTVIFIVFVVALCQFLYPKMFSDKCKCHKHNVRTETKQVTYADVETSFPALLPDHVFRVETGFPALLPDHVFRVETGAPRRAGGAREQKVFDLNENSEKVVEVMDGGDSSRSSSSSRASSSGASAARIESHMAAARPRRGGRGEGARPHWSRSSSSSGSRPSTSPSTRRPHFAARAALCDSRSTHDDTPHSARRP